MAANFFSGYSTEKPTSRVLNPPGGRSNNIFGFGDEPAEPTRSGKGRVNGAATQQESNNGINGHHYPASAAGAPVVVVNDRMKSNIFGDSGNAANTSSSAAAASTQAQANKLNRRGGFNPITGKPYDEDVSAGGGADAIRKSPAKEAPPPSSKDVPNENQVPTANNSVVGGGNPHAKELHTSSRVLQPPGGKSTKLW